MQEEKINELDKRLEELSKNIAVMSNDLKRQSVVIDKLSENFEKLTVFIERTNENDKKIITLFKKVDDIMEHGNKLCPVNIQRLKTLEKRVDKLNSYLMAIGLTIIAQLIGLVVYLIEKHII